MSWFFTLVSFSFLLFVCTKYNIIFYGLDFWRYVKLTSEQQQQHSLAHKHRKTIQEGTRNVFFVRSQHFQGFCGWRRPLIGASTLKTTLGYIYTGICTVCAVVCCYSHINSSLQCSPWSQDSLWVFYVLWLQGDWLGRANVGCTGCQRNGLFWGESRGPLSMNYY